MYKKQISENKIEGDTEDLRPYKAQTGQETYKSRKIREEKLKKTCSKEEIDWYIYKSNIHTFADELVSSENIGSYLHCDDVFVVDDG